MAVSFRSSPAGLDVSRPEALFQTQLNTSTAYGPEYDVSPDGRFLMNVTSTISNPITVIVNWQEELRGRAPTK